MTLIGTNLRVVLRSPMQEVTKAVIAAFQAFINGIVIDLFLGVNIKLMR